MDKDSILDEIKRTAASNGGVPLGTARFEKETGIRKYDWLGKYWARWGEALREAGFKPNELQGRYSDDHVIDILATVVREIGHIPTSQELRLRRRSNPSMPNKGVFERIAPTKPALIQTLIAYCREHAGFEDVLAICEEYQTAHPPERARPERDRAQTFGDVYLIKSGKYYKIGYSVSAERRTREFQIQLPDLPTRIHTIRSDDPRGVEAYWHKRFETKRVRPDAEFFKLDAADVRAFRAWKRIAP